MYLDGTGALYNVITGKRERGGTEKSAERLTDRCYFYHWLFLRWWTGGRCPEQVAGSRDWRKDGATPGYMNTEST